MPRGGVEVELYSFFDPSARLVWVVNAKPRPRYLHERDTVPIADITTALGGCGVSRLPPGLDPRNVQPVPSRCNYYVFPAPRNIYTMWQNGELLVMLRQVVQLTTTLLLHLTGVLKAYWRCRRLGCKRFDCVYFLEWMNG